jgi:hypothetical protein
MLDIEAKRAARRAQMPLTTAFVEQYAEWGAVLVYACENGITYGKKPQEENVFDIPPLYRMATHVERVKR